MVNSSSSVLSEAPCSNFPQVSARLLVSPPPKQSPASTQVTTSPSAAHSICSQGFRSSGCSRVSFTHFETNSEQGPITMQTRIAVRDTTPHRFQIIPLREAKSRYNLNQITTVQHIPEDLKHQPHTSPHLDLEPSFIPTLSQPPLLRTFHGPGGEKNDELSFMDSSTNLIPHKDYVLQTPKGKGEAERCNTGPPILYKPALQLMRHHEHQKHDESPRQVKQLNSSHISSTSLEKISMMQKQRHLEANKKFPGDHRTCNAMTGKAKPRACSEDLTRGQGQSVRSCVYERLRPTWSRDDSQRYSTKRHAIYSDTLVLPLVSPEMDLAMPTPRRILLAPTFRNSQIATSHTCSHGTKLLFPENVFDQLQNANMDRFSSIAMRGSQSEKIMTSERIPVVDRHSPTYSHLPSVPHLRFYRKSRDSATIKSSIISTLGGHREHPLKYSATILDLLAQLDQAIEEWSNFG